MSKAVWIMRVFVILPALLAGGCATSTGLPQHLLGTWGGPHIGLTFQGGLADVQFDCASGSIDDPIYPGPDGSFAVKGTYRTGAPGPIRVGQFFKSQEATYSGQVAKGAGKAPKTMSLSLTLEDGSKGGPFMLTEGSAPELTRCL